MFELVNNAMNDIQIVENEIQEFLISSKRWLMINGENYFQGNHDILSRERTVIGEGGELETVENLPNNKIVDNQYRKMVIQKSNYLLGKPISISTENEKYSKILSKNVFNKNFLRLIKNVGEGSLNAGLAWLYCYYDEQGQFKFKRFSPSEVIPGWKDAEHTVLDYAIRIYDVIAYEGLEQKIITKVELYTLNGIHYFEYDDTGLKPVEPYSQSYFAINDQEYNWSRIPLIPFKYNNKEIPLIKMVKSLQDGLNLIESNFQNQMEEDTRNTILVLVNYDGENLGEFRKNLSTYGAVKVKTVDGAGGDLKTLQVEVNSENYKTIINIFKKSIIENAMGYDAKDDRLSGNPNQMNIQSMYSDIDLDADGMETEYQASFEELLWFVNCHLANTNQGNFEDEIVDITFNRNIMMNESEIIDNVNKSSALLSEETVIAKHPYVDDPAAELKRIKAQREKDANPYTDAFGGDEVNEE